MEAVLGLIVASLGLYLLSKLYEAGVKWSSKSFTNLKEDPELPLTEEEERRVEAVKDNYTFWFKNKYGIHFFNKGGDIHTGKIYIMDKNGKIKLYK